MTAFYIREIVIPAIVLISAIAFYITMLKSQNQKSPPPTKSDHITNTSNQEEPTQ